MSGEQDPLNPDDPAYYAPRLLRERSRSPLSERGSSTSHAALDTQLRKAISDSLRTPLDPEVFNEPPALARELRRAALVSVAARFAAAAVLVTVVVLVFVIFLPASRQSDAGATPSDVTGSTTTALPQAGQKEDRSKPALAEFQGFLGSAPAGQPATNEQSPPLLQQFLQWRKKADSSEASQ
jgi:hypothetical protein